MGGVKMGLFKFVDFIGNQIDTLMDKMENSIDKFGNYLDNTIGKKLVVNQQYILSELSKQRKTIKDQSENDGKKFINNKSKPDNVTQFVDSKFDNEFKET
jgi:3-hydroxyacyl-CoA dehydrogenase